MDTSPLSQSTHYRLGEKDRHPIIAVELEVKAMELCKQGVRNRGLTQAGVTAALTLEGWVGLPQEKRKEGRHDTAHSRQVQGA